MQKQETRLQNEIRVALSPYGVVLRWNSGFFETKDNRKIRIGQAGVSDLLFIGNGYIAWLEVKVNKNKASKTQNAFLKRMRELGHIAETVYSVEEALKVCKVIE